MSLKMEGLPSTNVSTSDKRNPRIFPGSAPEAASNVSMMTVTGALPCSATLPQDTDPASSATAATPPITGRYLPRMSSAPLLALDDSRRDENQQLATLFREFTALKQPAQNRNLVQSRRPIVRRRSIVEDRK